MEKDYAVAIANNCDNLEILDKIDYLLIEIINDIEYMNEEKQATEDLDLGNNYYIKREDLETLESARETIHSIVSYNSK